jgi:thiol-disulfide isomerase/thioredoxin
MKDFWEHTTWPRDVSGIRYGLPSTESLASWIDSEDEVDEDAPMISAPPLRQGAYQAQEPEMLEEEEVQAGSPHVLLVDSVYTLQEKIINSETTCLLFLSAPFCRTCRYLKPLYQRMARETAEKMAADGKPMKLVFAKAEATGQMSKNLGQALGVDSVPSFLLFKKGQRFGETLSVSRIPSAKLDRAVELLQDDLPWNEALFDKDEEPAKPEQTLIGSGGFHFCLLKKPHVCLNRILACSAAL